MSEETEHNNKADATPSIKSCTNLWSSDPPSFVIVPTVDRIQMVKELSREIRGNRISHRFFYWDVECAYNWVTLEEDTNYQLALQSRQLLSCSYDKIQAAILAQTDAPYDLVNLGVGSGSDDKVMLEKLSKVLCDKFPDTRSKYFPVDISFDLIYYAIGTLSESREIDRSRITPCLLNADFFKLPMYLEAIEELSPNPKLFSLLGSTLSNYSESDLLDAIDLAMTDKDYLLLGVDCIYDNLTAEQIRQIHTKSAKGYRFLMGPLRSIVSVGDPQLLPSHLRYRFPDEENISPYLPDRVYSSLDDHKKVVTVMHKLQLNEGKYINLSSSHKYKSEGLVEFLSNRGYQNILTITPQDYPYQVTQYEDCSYKLLLLKKGPAPDNQVLQAGKVPDTKDSKEYEYIKSVLDGWNKNLPSARLPLEQKQELNKQITILLEHLADQKYDTLQQIYKVLFPRFIDSISIVKDELKNAVDLLQYRTDKGDAK